MAGAADSEAPWDLSNDGGLGGMVGVGGGEMVIAFCAGTKHNAA